MGLAMAKGKKIVDSKILIIAADDENSENRKMAAKIIDENPESYLSEILIGLKNRKKKYL